MSNQRVFFATILAVLVFALPGFAQDTDGDGMPASYENTCGCLQLNTVDDGVDHDTDGMATQKIY